MADAEELIPVLLAAGVSDPKVLSAARRVPRSAFVPPEFESEASADAPVPISHGQVTSQPSLIARMVEALELAGHEQVLEIGTGYGYQTALLAHLAAKVISIEYWPDLAAHARDNLERQGVGNVEVIAGDGTQGAPGHAPYDGIIVSAAFPEVPRPLVEQLRVGGRLVQPMGSGGGETVVLFDREETALARRKELTPASFVRLRGRYGYPE